MAFVTVLTLAIPMSGPDYSVWITVCVALYGLQHFTVINLTLGGRRRRGRSLPAGNPASWD